MTNLDSTQSRFLEMAHQIVWCTAATVDTLSRPRTRVLHPIWEASSETESGLVGWVATGRTPVKTSNLEVSPYVSLNYWNDRHDTCTADCLASWRLDTVTRERVWGLFKSAPAPVGYDPSIIPGWEGPDSPTFAVLRLDPYRLRVFPGSVLLGTGGEIGTWRASR